MARTMRKWEMAENKGDWRSQWCPAAWVKVMRKDEAEIIFADAIKKCFLQHLNREHSWEKNSAWFWLSREQRIAAGKCHPNVLAGWPQHTQMQHVYMKQKTPQRPQRRASEMTKMCKWENILEINITFRKGKMHADVIDTFNDIGSSE